MDADTLPNHALYHLSYTRVFCFLPFRGSEAYTLLYTSAGENASRNIGGTAKLAVGCRAIFVQRGKSLDVIIFFLQN